jgi:hypothetical protein
LSREKHVHLRAAGGANLCVVFLKDLFLAIACGLSALWARVGVCCEDRMPTGDGEAGQRNPTWNPTTFSSQLTSTALPFHSCTRSDHELIRNLIFSQSRRDLTVSLTLFVQLTTADLNSLTVELNFWVFGCYASYHHQNLTLNSPWRSQGDLQVAHKTSAATSLQLCSGGQLTKQDSTTAV